MKALYQFIVSTDSRYNNIKEIDGKELVVNSEITERDARFVNRVGKVESIPSAIKTPVEIGDEIIVHHNVFRTWYDQTGTLKNGSGFLGDNQFAVHYDQVFAYKRNNKWMAMPGYVFVEPITETKAGILVDEIEEEIPLRGDVVIPNANFKIGDRVGFTPDSEYEFIIDNERLYRIREIDINIIYNGFKERNGKNNSFLEDSFKAT